MKKMTVLLAGALLALATFGSVANATTIGYNKVVLGDGQFTADGIGVYNLSVETFDAPLQVTLTGNFDLVTGTVTNHNAAPYGLSTNDPSQYLTVPKDFASSPTVTASFGPQLYDYFGIWWGSADNYNKLEFLNGTTVVATYIGSSVAPPANGAQNVAATNRYVNFYDLPDFNSFRLTSTQYAFEADNIAVGNVVPEPGTMVLFGLGMLGMAVYGKRRMNKNA